MAQVNLEIVLVSARALWYHASTPYNELTFLFHPGILAQFLKLRHNLVT